MNNTIKIFLVLLFCIIAGFAETYYFIKELDTGGQSQNVPNAPGPQPTSDVELVEIDSDSIPATPPGFRPTTVEEIHNKGLLTPSESFALAQQQGSVDQGMTEGYSYASWITTYTKSGYKYAEGGSRTGRTWIPGTLFLKAKNECLWDNNPNIVFLPKSHLPNGDYYRTWGWNTQWVCRRVYPTNTIARGHQQGWHKYSGSQDPFYTHVIKEY